MAAAHRIDTTSAAEPNSGIAESTPKKELILRAAFRLLIEKGYEKTSYTDIARKSGCTRALVQYHYPKKDEFVTAFVDRLLEAVDAQLHERNLMTGSCFADFSITGYLYFNFLLSNEELRTLALDLIAQRDTSLISIERMAAWQHRSQELADIDDAIIRDAVLLAVGGAHELIYHHLTNEIPIDLRMLLARTIGSYALLLGFPQKTVDDLIRRPPLDAEIVEAANTDLLRVMRA